MCEETISLTLFSQITRWEMSGWIIAFVISARFMLVLHHFWVRGPINITYAFVFVLFFRSISGF